MGGSSWGGSEELWSKTALLALAEGHTVETLTYGWSSTPPGIVKLREAGVDTKFYYGNRPTLLDRVAVKLGLQQHSEKLPTMSADVYIISNGSIWDFIHRRQVTDTIIGLGKPYILLNHNAFDWGNMVEDNQRAYAIRVLQKAVKVLFVSERNRQGAERQLAHSIPNSQIVSNPVGIREASIKPFPASNSLLLASVGSIDCHIKGQDLLLEALSSDTWKRRDFRLRIYGKGGHVNYLHKLIELYGLQEKVTLEGHVSDVDQIWETNQVLVLSSLTEGVPMVVVEAMLSGRPVLATDVGAADQYVVNGHTGFLIGVAKAKYLAVGLEELWENRASLQQMGENAFHHAVAITNFSPIKNFLSIIEAAHSTAKADAIV